MKRRFLDFLAWLLVLIVVMCGLTACTTANGSFCQIAPQLKYSQRVYDAMTDAEAAKHLAYLKTGERLCHWN